MWPRLANVALGSWLMAAPAVLGYSTASALASGTDRTLGPLIATFATAAIWPELRPLRRVETGLGGLAIAMPLVLWPLTGWPGVAVANSVVTGLAVCALGLVRGEVRARFGGGWRSVWSDDVDTVTGRRDD